MLKHERYNVKHEAKLLHNYYINAERKQNKI